MKLHEAMHANLRGVRGKQKAPTKELISLRVSRDVLGRFRATGAGWQSRMDEALREWIERREAKGNQRARPSDLVSPRFAGFGRGDRR